MITLSILLALSLGLNIVLAWYARELAKEFSRFTKNVQNLEGALNSFGAHLTSVHELEMFYGDDTLGGLMKHSKAIVRQVEEFYEDFSIEEDLEEVGDGET